MPRQPATAASRTSRSRAASDVPVGIDFGGSGIKGAPVDLAEGEFAADRVRIDTPQPSTPDAVAEVFAELLEG
ncbi:MAG: hypothetical protein R2734_21610, partial [Nocardioides sp.]